MKIRERRAAAERLVNHINYTLTKIADYKRDTHGNSYRVYELWPTITKTIFITAITVAIILLLGVKITGDIMLSLPFAISLLVASAVMYWSPVYRKCHLIRWNTKKTITRLNGDAQRFDKELIRLSEERQAENNKRFFAHNYNRYAERKSEIQDEVATYRPQFEALYGIIRTELGGEIYPTYETYEDGQKFESDIEVRIDLPVTDHAGLNTQIYEFTKHDLEELVIKIIKLRPVMRERRRLLEEVGIPTT